MLFYIKKFRIFLISIIVFFLCLFSFLFNGLKVANDKWFLSGSFSSEELVLMGLHESFQHDKSINLGRYKLNNEYTVKKSHEYYEKNLFTGEFDPYFSNYGFQVKIFKFFLNGCSSVKCLQFFVVFITSILISIFFIILSIEFGIVSSFIFSSSFFLSPWFVVFAKNLYFLPVSLLAPILFSIIYTSYYVKKKKYFFLFSAILLFLSYLINFLFRYEFLTAVGLSTCLPIIYILVRENINNLKIFKLIILNFIIFCAAFVISLSLHAYSINKNFKDGYNLILNSAKIRTIYPTSERSLENYCKGDQDCINDLSKDSNISTITVITKYFIFPAFIPGSKKIDLKNSPILSTGLYCSEYPGCIKKFKSFFINKKFKLLFKNLYKTIFSKQGFNWVFDRLIFVIFFIFAYVLALKSKKEIKYSFIFSILAPLSWFILAKNHSNAHYQINYLVWFIPYIPFAFLVISNYLYKNLNIRKNLIKS